MTPIQKELAEKAKRVCKICHEEKIITDFASAGTYKGKKYKQNMCKNCYNMARPKQQIKYPNRPWMRHCKGAEYRCKTEGNPYYERGIKFYMTIGDFKELWFRDKAWLLEKPSIDRIDSKGNYEFGNCRFIERSENAIRRGRGKIEQYDKNGNLIKVWDNLATVSKELSISKTAILNCIDGRSKISSGYVWKLLNRRT